MVTPGGEIPVRCVIYLERRGYVERLPDPRDGRAKIVVLTEAGLRWIEVAVERVGEIEDALSERMGGQERLEELADSLEELMILSAERMPTRAGSARNSARTPDPPPCGSGPRPAL